MFLNRCPCCNADEPEDLAHLLLACPTWQQQRGRFLLPALVLLPTSLGSVQCKTSLVLGGVVGGTLLPNWDVSGSGTTTPVYVHVARYLQAISALHSATVWRHTTKQSQSPSGYGSSAYTSEG